MIRLFYLLLALAVFFSGCAPVPQWKREYLSDPAMLPAPDALEQELDGHRHKNMEGGTSGGGNQGGGCGC